MKLIFESLNDNKIAINEGIIGTVILTGVAVGLASKLLKNHIKKIESDTKDKKEKMIIGITKIDKLPIDYKIKPGEYFENGYIKELIYRNVTNINKATEFSKKKSMSVKEYISIYEKDEDSLWLDKYRKFEKKGYILYSSGGGDDTIIDSGKLYYIDHETDEVIPKTFEDILYDNWESIYDVLVQREII